MVGAAFGDRGALLAGAAAEAVRCVAVVRRFGAAAIAGADAPASFSSSSIASPM